MHKQDVVSVPYGYMKCLILEQIFHFGAENHSHARKYQPMETVVNGLDSVNTYAHKEIECRLQEPLVN